MRPIRFLAAALLALGIVGLPAAAMAAQPGAQPGGGAHSADRPAVAALPGDVGDFSFRSFDAVYRLSRDAQLHAALDVTETIVAVFPTTDQNRGILRDIPDRYGSARLQTQVVSVVDERGKPVKYTASDRGDTVELALGTDAYVHGPTTYVIHYTQVDTIRHFTDTDDDEFYWDVNGTGWGQPFGQVSAQVQVDPALVSALNDHTACYAGAQGSTTPCPGGVSGSDGSFTASASNLAPGEGLTVAIGFVSGTFVDVSSDPNDQPGSGSGSETPVTPGQVLGVLLSLLGFPAVVLGTVSAAISASSRTQPARGTIVPQYSPPDGLDVMVAAHLIGKPTTAIPAQLVELSVTGRTRLLGYAVESTRAADYAIQLVDPSGLDPLEKSMVDALFGPDAAPGAAHDLRKYGDDALAARLTTVTDSARATADGYFDGRRRTVGGVVLFVLAVVFTLVALLGSVILGGFVGLVTGFIGIVAGLIGVGLASVGFRGARKLGDEGARLNDYLLGMRMYLQLAEEDRLRVLQSPTGAERIDVGDGKQLVKLYEKLLPWAIIWGVEDQWSKVLEIELQRADATPDFWVGQQPFASAALVPLLSGLGPATRAIPSTTSTGSGGSFSSFAGGSFGGGFSGGGGGGGGGGGR